MWASPRYNRCSGRGLAAGEALEQTTTGGARGVLGSMKKVWATGAGSAIPVVSCSTSDTD